MTTTTAVQTTTEEPNDPGQLLKLLWCETCRWRDDYDGYSPLCKRCHCPAELVTPSELHAREQRAEAEALAAAMAKAQAEQVEAAVRKALAKEPIRREPATDANLLGLDAAADRLGLGPSTVRKLAAKCELPSVKIGGRLLFKPADLVAYAEARRRSPERVRKLVSEKA